VSVVLIFGEIIPSAVFTGPSQLTLAARMSIIVRSVKFLLMPIAWPLSMMLDRCLGHNDEETYNRSQIKGLIRALVDSNDDTIIDIDEANMMHGVLELHYKTAVDVGHDIVNAKMLADDTTLDMKKFVDIDSWGHSRVFVFRRSPTDTENWGTDIMGVLLLKKLLTTDPNANTPMKKMADQLKQPVLISPDENLLKILNKFQEGSCHMALVTKDPEAVQQALDDETPIPEDARPTMFCTLEDVIEELLKEEIYDEEDIEKDNERKSGIVDTTTSGLSATSNRSKPPKRSLSRLRTHMAFDRLNLNMQGGIASSGKEQFRSKLQRARTFTTEQDSRRTGNLSGDMSEPLLKSTDSMRRNVSQ